MKLLKYTESTTGVEVVVVAQNVFAVTKGVNEVSGRNETRIFGAGDDFLGVDDDIQQVVNDLAST